MSLSWPSVAGTAINTAVGTLGATGTGAYTIVALMQPAGTTVGAYLGMKVSTSFDRQVILDSGKFFGTGDFSGFGTPVSGDWQIIGQSKAAGTNVYRWHYWDYTTNSAKTHADGTGTHGDPGTLTAVQIGNADNRGNGLIAVVAVWKRVLSDAEFNSLCTASLADWAALAPDALWPLNVAAASVVDVTGHGADASSVIGTISAGADPPGFSYALATPANGTFGATLPALTAALSGQAVATATLAGQLPALAAALSGQATVTAALGAAFPALTSALSGGLTVTAQLGATLPALVAALTNVTQQLPGVLVAAGTTTTLTAAGAAAATLTAAGAAATLAASGTP